MTNDPTLLQRRRLLKIFDLAVLVFFFFATATFLATIGFVYLLSASLQNAVPSEILGFRMRLDLAAFAAAPSLVFAYHCVLTMLYMGVRLGRRDFGIFGDIAAIVITWLLSALYLPMIMAGNYTKELKIGDGWTIEASMSLLQRFTQIVDKTAEASTFPVPMFSVVYVGLAVVTVFYIVSFFKNEPEPSLKRIA